MEIESSYYVTHDNVVGLGAVSVFITATVLFFKWAALPGTYTELTANDQANKRLKNMNAVSMGCVSVGVCSAVDWSGVRTHHGTPSLNRQKSMT